MAGDHEHRAFELVAIERRTELVQDRERLAGDGGGVVVEEDFEIDGRKIVLLDHVGDLFPLLDGDLPCLHAAQLGDELLLLLLTLRLARVEGAELRGFTLQRIDDLRGGRVFGLGRNRRQHQKRR